MTNSRQLIIEHIKGRLYGLFTVFPGGPEDINECIKILNTQKFSQDIQRRFQRLRPILTNIPNYIENLYRNKMKKLDVSGYWGEYKAEEQERIKREALNRKNISIRQIQRIQNILDRWQKERNFAEVNEERIPSSIFHLLQQVENICKNIRINEKELDDLLDKYRKIRESQG